MSTDRAPSVHVELANALTHGVGFVASLIGLPILVLAAANRGERTAIIGASVFGAALVALYAASTLYHAVSHPTLKQRLRVLDHACIYLLIAGTYTPFTLGVLRGRWGWTLFGIVWTLAALGVLFKVLFGGGAMAKLSTAVYVAMGWVVIIAIKPLIAAMDSAGLMLLIAGGLLYTGGVVFYVDKRRAWSHPVWHLFVMGGSVCHYFAVLFYAFPRALMATSLLVLLDDITSMMDDVAVLTKVAATKTSGVMGDDLALNAEQASGVHVDRELPVVWAVAKGSLLNKVILVPVALVISAFAPWAVLPLMMIGGLFLCYEGVEKLVHKYLHREEAEATPAVLAHPEMNAEQLVAFEQGKIKGAIRTDFVLSAEIIVISLGTMATAPISQQILALSLVSLAATVFVYGLVAGIVKLDDLGLALHRRGRAIGGVILKAAPMLMKSLSVLGTAAMFTVGGGILVHGVHAVDVVIESWAHATGPLAVIAKPVLDALVGIVAGGIVVLAMTLGQRVFRKG